VDKRNYKKILSAYQNIKEKYDCLASYLRTLFRHIAKKLDIYPIIEARAKSLESFAEKIIRPGKNYRNPINEITDFCGVRVITHTLDEVDRMQQVLEEYFIIDRINSEDKKEKLAFREFGYLSRHFIVQLKEFIPLPGFDDRVKFNHLEKLKAELQLRTLAQHIWADIYHEMGYKNEFQLPSRWEREFARIAALLENCDRGFQEIKNDMVLFESNYGKYMDDEQLGALAERLEILLAFDQSINIFHRLIKTYSALGQWEKSVRLYTTHRDLMHGSAPILRDVGMTFCKAYPDDAEQYAHGQTLIKESIAMNPRDCEAYCCLGGTYFRKNRIAEAVAEYKKALRHDATNPYALGNYILGEVILRKDPRIIEYFNSTLVHAMQRCRRQVQVGANLPWALFDLGLFSFYLNDPVQSVYYYSAGIKNSLKTWMAFSARRPFADLMQHEVKLKNLDLMFALLRQAEWVLTDPRQRKQEVWLQKQGVPAFKKPVLVLAGGCAGLEAHYKELLKQLKQKLGQFRGTIISGGTRSGIAELAGELQENSKDVHTIGYLPGENSPAVKRLIDRRYKEFRFTRGDDFSIRETIAFWEDFLASGGDPRTVKLIGFNGGSIAGFEYRLALAYGARVGVIENSGRQADALLDDPLWRTYRCEKKGESNEERNLYVLALGANDVEEFLAD
jgi:ppGpp synthetase/RelA/SpoT-type nucleotidyltranferase